MHTEDLLRFLRQASIELSSSLDYLTTLQRAVRLALPMLGDYCAIGLAERDAGPRFVAGAHADPDKDDALQEFCARYRPRPDSPSPMLAVLRGGTSRVRNNIPTVDTHALMSDDAQFQLMRAVGMPRATMSVPLKARDQVFGALMFVRTHSGASFSDDELATAEELARIAGLAVDNARLYRDTQRRLAELTTVQHVARAIGEALHLDSVFQTVVTQISAAFGYQLVCIYLREGERLVLRASVGYPSIFPFIRLERGVCGRVARTGEPVFIADRRGETDFLEALPGVTQMIAVPLTHGAGEVLGVLAVESTGTPKLTVDDFSLLRLLADQVSVAVVNARLFADVRESEQRYRALVAQAADGILLTDYQGHVLEANTQALELTGYSSTALSGMRLDALFGTGDSTSQAFAPFISSNQPLQLRRADGGFVTVEVSESLIEERGQIVRLMIVRDIGERVRTEEARRALERQLLDLQRLESMGVLAGGIAHDFNNLLTALLGNAALALLDLPPESAAAVNIQQVERTARRASELVRQLLVYAGKEPVVVQQVDLNELSQEMLDLLRASLPKQVRLQTDFASLPAVQADAAQLRQVLMNLVINAAEALAGTPGTITLTTRVRRIEANELTTWLPSADIASGDYVVIEVADTGCGMEQATVQRIFEPFFTTKPHGRGLGLAAVLGIVRAHHGALRVVSMPGVGTRFTILLPGANTA